MAEIVCELPVQLLVALMVMPAIGSGSIVSVCVPVAVQPFASVAFHVHTPAALAVTVAPVVTTALGEVHAFINLTMNMMMIL